MFESVIIQFRKLRSEKLGPVGKALADHGISANVVTTLSLISGATSVYFLFNNYYLFLIFAILHLALDGLDGVIARSTKETKKGRLYDLYTDNLIGTLAVIKAGIFLQDYYAYIAAFLYAISIIVYARTHYPTLFVRTSALFVLAIATFPQFPYQNSFIVGGYLLVGVLAIYSLATHLKEFLKSRTS